MLKTRIRHLGSVKVQIGKIRQAFERRQASVSNTRQLQVQPLQIRQAFEIRERRVGNFRVGEVQVHQAGDVLQRNHDGIRNAGARQTEVRLAPVQVRRDRTNIDALLRQRHNGFLFGGGRLEVRRQHRTRDHLWRFLGIRRFRPDRAFVDPFLDQIELRLRQRLAFGRHEIIITLRQGHPTERIALRRIPGNQSRSALATLQRRLARIEPQFALLLLRTMTLEAVLLENRLNVFNEVHLAFRSGGRIQGDGNSQRDGERGFHSRNSHSKIPCGSKKLTAL